MFIPMHVTVDDVNFCDGLKCLYVKYKSRACEFPLLIHGFLPVKTRLFIVCDTAFYAIIAILACCLEIMSMLRNHIFM